MSAHPADGRPKGLQSLSAQAAVAGRLAYQDGKTGAEIARELGISVGTVRGLLSAYREWDRDRKLVAAMRR